MKIPKYFIAILSIIIIAACSLFYFINQIHQTTSRNSTSVTEARKVLRNIDAAFYTVTDLERTIRKYQVSRDKLLEKDAQNQINTLHKLVGELHKTGEFGSDPSDFLPLLVKKLAFEEEIINNEFNSNQPPSIASDEARKQLSQQFYLAEYQTRQEYVTKINSLFAVRQAIDAMNFKSSIVISIVAVLLIIITLLQLLRNRRLRKLAEDDTRQIEIEYKTLVENSGVGLLTTDLNGNMTFANKRIKDFTGLTCSEIIGKHFSVLVDQEWVPLINDKFKKQFQYRNEHSEISFPLRNKSGNTIWIEQSSSILYENGAPKGFQCIVKDVTEKRRIDNELKKIEEEREEYQFRLQSILDNTPLIIFIKDLNGKYLLANQSYRSAFNMTKDQIIGKTDFELVSENDARRYHEIDEYVIKAQKNVEVEETLQRDGVSKNLLIVKFPLFDKNNTIYGIGGIASDITERYLYGLHLIEAKSKAEMAEQLQEQFLANMSHEIRTPMNGIIGMTNILLSTPMSQEQRDFLHVIKKSSDSLMVLMNDILDLSKIKAGKLRIEKIDFRLRETIEQSISTFRVLINEKGLKLRISVDLNTPDSLTGDPHRLNQILNNLISNAIKFTAEGEINVEIKFVAQKENEVELSFSVSDTGIGIPKEKLEAIFESFSQAESGTSRKFGGSGLGLTITKKLIELQNGTIDVNSVPGEGTTFIFSLKYPLATNVVTKQFQTKQETFNQALAGKRILVVEDNEANQKVIYHMLDKAGIETDLAENGKVAIKLLEEGFEYDLIIMDLQMPEMDGFQTTTYLRQHLKLTIPIIAMTASALRNEKIKCMELGMNEYMNKPFVPAELFRELRKFLLKKEEDFSEKTNLEVFCLTKNLYSLNSLLELDDPECLCEVLQLFLDSTPVIMGEIKQGISEENWEEVYKKSHKLKSSIGILQMKKVMSHIAKVESDAKERKNLEDIAETFEKAEALLAEVTPMVETELQKALAILVKN